MLIVHSSQGTLGIDDTGKVTGILVNGEAGPIILDLESIAYLLYIDRFNLKEYSERYGENNDEEFDILDLGYWTKGGTYEPPVEEWREHIIEEKTKEEEK